MSETRLARGRSATLVGLLVNGLLAAGKFAAGVAGHSHALIADAVESFADVFSSLIVWHALGVAEKPADEDHPYGHGKAEPLAAAVISTVLLLAAAGIAVQSMREIIAPHTRPEPFTLLVLIVVVLIKEGMYRAIHKVGVATDNVAVRSDAWHHRSDAITSLAAALGIGVALIGGKGYESADDVAAILAAGIIAWNGWRLLRPALDELMDTAPDPAWSRQVRDLSLRVDGVHAVEKCFVRKMGYHLFVDMHLEVDPEMTVEKAHAIAHEVKDAVRRGMPAVRDVLVHIEPAHRPGK